MESRRVVRRIDHLFVSVEDAQAVFEMLQSRLGLVVLAPIQDWGPFTSGAFNLGNIYLEILQTQPGLPAAPPDALEVNGLAFEPEPLDVALGELDRRRIAHSPPIPMVRPEGIELPAWNAPLEIDPEPAPGSPLFVNVVVPGPVGDNAIVFCSESVIAPTSAWREAMRTKLDDMPDRGLPIDSVTEVVVGAKDVEAERDRWQALVDPVTEQTPGSWRFDGGPALRLVEFGHDAIVGLTLQVASLDRAERYLKDHGMLASSTGNELAISPEALDGLNLTLVGERGRHRRV